METKDLILNKAIELFESRGIRNLTMDEIASQLGISKRTIYTIYAKKENLIADYLEKDYEYYLKFHQTIESQSQNAIEILLYYIKHDSIKDTTIHHNNMKEIKKYYPQIFNYIVLKYREEKTNLMVKILKRGQEEGVIRKDIDPIIISQLISVQMAFLLEHIEHIFDKVEKSKKEILKSLLISFTRGVSTMKGYRLIDELVEQYNHNLSINKIK